jgi:hypothetical protein
MECSENPQRGYLASLVLAALLAGSLVYVTAVNPSC